METALFNNSSKMYSKENVAQAKRKLKLDLNFANNPGAKKQRPTTLNPLLTSPDLNMLKLASPELEQLVLQQVPGAQHLFTHVTHEQEEFAKGFVDSLEQMHHQNSSVTTSGGSNLINTSTVVTAAGQQQPAYTTLQPPQPPSDYHTHQIKEEPQTIPGSSPPLSPINMENQERIKLERKRLRNRIAASKCRRRKLERIGRLEDKVANLKGENSDLQAVVNKLKDQVYALKKEVMEHVQSGCQISIATHQ